MTCHIYYPLMLLLAIYSIGCTNQTSGTTARLKDVFADKFVIGVAIDNPTLDADENGLLQHFSSITPEVAMKPRSIQPVQGVFKFEQANAVLKLAEDNSMTVHGHTLLWYNNCPEWFKISNQAEAARRSIDHIRKVVTKFRHQVFSWDVVNEALSVENGNDKYLRNADACSKNITEDLIHDAFVAAHEANPEAKLYYNDFDLAYRGKRERLIKRLKNLKARDTPIDGVGMQSHFTTISPTITEIKDTIKAIKGLGLKIAISELDVNTIRSFLPNKKDPTDDQGKALAREKILQTFAIGVPQKVEQKLTDRYQELFELFVRYADDIERVTFWGLHDAKNWLRTKQYTFLPPDIVTPLPFDKDRKPKKAFEVIWDVGQNKAAQ